jgi:UDP-N-acetylmuramyl pentapeptide phosphotransferase/UDP-N-acetylglucosamine-1-phosphate transferase
VTLFVAAVAGFLAGRLVWVSLASTFSSPVFERTNHRGAVVPTAAGIAVPVALVLVEAGRVVAGAAGWGEEGMTGARAVTVLAALGFGLLGAFDDLASEGGDARGFRGHIASLFRGRLTTGGLKLVGGACVSLLACAAVSGGASVGALLRDAALVALAANLGNLFDRAPGRTLKVGAFAFLLVGVFASQRTPLVAPAVVVGAALALVRDDLHERLMLGDAGANVLGGVVGLAVVLSASPSARGVVLIVLGALNALSEIVSFSAVIDRIGPLRALDRAGRLPRHSL